jgi:uncharacterized protein (TIGR00369 family)
MSEYCFACGQKNERGLKLSIHETEDGVATAIMLPRWTQGYDGIVHGGIISTILDEMAVAAAAVKGYLSVTAELSIRIKKPMYIETQYHANAHVTGIKYTLIQAVSEILGENDEMIASAQAKLMKRT